LAGATARFGALILCATLAAACSSAASFSTELDAPDGLAPGAPVTEQGAVIGSVTAVNPLPAGISAVNFEVDRSQAEDFHRDSIMVLRTGPEGPALDLMNPDPLSPPAPPGSVITGASGETEANLILAGRGVSGFIAGLAGAMAAMGATLQGLNTSPAFYAFQADLLEFERRAAASSARNSAAINQQWQRLNREAVALEQQLIRAGHSAEAERLRRELEQFARTMTTPPPALTSPPAPPNTLVTPRVH
jgi:ABC-type transporter Mla subunit MlaD